MLIDYIIIYPMIYLILLYLSDENIVDLKPTFVDDLYGYAPRNFTVSTLFISYYFLCCFILIFLVFDFLTARRCTTDYIINIARQYISVLHQIVQTELSH